MGFGTSVHAIDHVLANASRPAITPSFSAHAGVAKNMQAGSVEAAINQSRAGLEQIKDARHALAAQMDNKAQSRGESFSMGDVKSPSLTGEIAKGIGVAALTAIDPTMGAFAGAAQAVSSALQPTGGTNHTVSNTEYEASSFKSSTYIDAMGGAWGADGYAATPEPTTQTIVQQPVPGINPYLLQAAKNTVEELGEKQVLRDLGTATKTEQMLEGQLGATLQFAEKNLNGPTGHSQGPKPLGMSGTSGPGMAMG